MEYVSQLRSHRFVPVPQYFGISYKILAKNVLDRYLRFSERNPKVTHCNLPITYRERKQNKYKLLYRGITFKQKARPNSTFQYPL